MKRFVLLALFFAFFGTCFSIQAQESRIDFSITLSGAILWGVDYHYALNPHSAFRAGVYLGVEKWHFVPGIHANYQYTFLPDKKWSPYLGVGPDLMVTTDPKRGWVHLTLLKFPVGAVYHSSPKNFFGMEIWPAYFAAKRKLIPLIGLSGVLSRKF